jgi:hypothetical protein
MEFRRLMDTGNLVMRPEERVMRPEDLQTLSTRQPQYPKAYKAKFEAMHAPAAIAHQPQRKYLGVQKAFGELIPVINDAPFFRHDELKLNEPHQGLERMKSSRVPGGGSPFSVNTRAQLMATRRYEARLQEHGALLNSGIGAHQLTFTPKKRNNKFKSRSEMVEARRKEICLQNTKAGGVIDFDGDGNIDTEEILLSHMVDTNHDGLVTQEEIRQWIDSQQTQQATGKGVITLASKAHAVALDGKAYGDEGGDQKLAAVDVMLEKLGQNYKRKADRPVFPAPKDITGDPKRREPPQDTEYHEGVYVERPAFNTRSELLAKRAKERVSKWGYHGEGSTIMTNMRGMKPNEIRGVRGGIKPKQQLPESPCRSNPADRMIAAQAQQQTTTNTARQQTARKAAAQDTGCAARPAVERDEGRAENTLADGRVDKSNVNYQRLLDIDRRLQRDRELKKVDAR